MTEGLTDVDLRPAFEAVQRNPAGDHALDSTMAPVYAAMREGDEQRVNDRAHLLERYLPLAETLLEVDCGVGHRLVGQDAVETAVGIESSPQFARRAFTRAPVIQGDARWLPAVDVDAIVALEYLTAEFDRRDLTSFVASAFGSLAPGGTLVFDVPLDDRVIDTDDLEVTDGGIRVRRRVDTERSENSVLVREWYELTDLLGEDTVTTEIERRYRLWDVGTVWNVVRDAGFDTVLITSGDVEPGGALVVASSETGRL